MKSDAHSDQVGRSVWSRWLVFLNVTTSLVLIAGTVVLTYRAMASSPTVGTSPTIKMPAVVQPYADAQIKGSLAAPVGLIVYSDFECPFCRTFAQEILPKAEELYVRTGRVLVAFRHFPMERIHPQAMTAAKAADCAAEQGRFWEAHDRIFELNVKLNAPGLRQAVLRTGVDGDTFGRCLDRNPADSVLRDLTGGRSIGVSGTPYILIGPVSAGGVRVIRILRGLPEFRTLADALDSALAQPSR